MISRKILIGLISSAVLVMALAFASPAAAQHEGGLGIKKVPLNIATADQLMKIDGMTEDLAEAIVEYRETKGYFKKPADLLNVPGMTQEVYEKLSPKEGSEGDIYCVPKAGTGDDDDEEPMLSPSKC
jgi:competence ComEA-like helix-hairpin-helix protein